MMEETGKWAKRCGSEFLILNTRALVTEYPRLVLQGLIIPILYVGVK